jgi:sodium-independent sulfate anion transporter 11
MTLTNNPLGGSQAGIFPAGAMQNRTTAAVARVFSMCQVSMTTGLTEVRRRQAGVAFPTGVLSAGVAVQTGGAFPSSFPSGPPLQPAAIAATLAISIGVLSLIVGSLKLGWLLNFISLPVLVGFFSGATLIIVQGQVPALLGEVGVSNIFILQGPEIVQKIGTANPFAIAIGISSIILLLILQYIGKKWGKRYPILWFLSISRNAIVLILSTGISFGLNKNRPVPLFAVTGEVPKGLHMPKFPELPAPFFLFIIAPLSIPIFIAAALEHVLIAKSFGQQNNYHIDQNQEIVFLGVANIANGFFGGMPVGGAIATSAVNSESGVKSPLGGIFASGVVLTSIYALTGTIFWIPKATLAAMILVAVIGVMPPQKLMLKYWKTSFMDFVAAFITMNATLVQSAEAGVGLGIVFMVLYTLTRIVFAHARPITRCDLIAMYNSDPSFDNERIAIPTGTQVIGFDEAIIFLNADRLRQQILDQVQTYQSGMPSCEQMDVVERSWSDVGQRRIDTMRKNSRLNTPTRYLPRIRVLVLDLTHVTFIDTTGLQMLGNMKVELLAYGGEDVEIRFVGLNAELKKKFNRFGWALATAEDSIKGLADGKDGHWEQLKPAIEAPRTVRDSGLDFGFGHVLTSDPGITCKDMEKGDQNVIVTSVAVKGGKAYKEWGW